MHSIICWCALAVTLTSAVLASLPVVKGAMRPGSTYSVKADDVCAATATASVRVGRKCIVQSAVATGDYHPNSFVCDQMGAKLGRPCYRQNARQGAAIKTLPLAGSGASVISMNRKAFANGVHQLSSGVEPDQDWG